MLRNVEQKDLVALKEMSMLSLYKPSFSKEILEKFTTSMADHIVKLSVLVNSSTLQSDQAKKQRRKIMGTLRQSNPTPVNVTNMISPGTGGAATAQITNVKAVTIPVPMNTATAGTGNAAWLSWVNPEPTTVIVTEVVTYYSATGTGGTYDLGVSDDGTGSSDDIINGGTHNQLSVYGYRAYRGRTGTQGAAVTGVLDTWVLGPGSTGTNNSIVGKQTEVTSTAAGVVVITYIALQS